MCKLVFEEVATNIIRHGYTDSGDHQIQVSIDYHEDVVVIGFEDDGFRSIRGRQRPECAGRRVRVTPLADAACCLSARPRGAWTTSVRFRDETGSPSLSDWCSSGAQAW